MSWRERAACLGRHALFYRTFGVAQHSPAVEEAKRVCRGCDVRDECLVEALRNNERDGVWGGMTARDRRRFVKAARRVAA